MIREGTGLSYMACTGDVRYGTEDVMRCKACTCVCEHGSGNRSIGRVERVRPSPARAARVVGVRIDGRRRARRRPSARLTRKSRFCSLHVSAAERT